MKNLTPEQLKEIERRALEKAIRYFYCPNEDDEPPTVEDWENEDMDRFQVWEPFEHFDNGEIEEQVEDLKEHYFDFSVTCIKEVL